MPNYWLLKTEPSTYSYDDLEKEKKTMWNGVMNPVALRNIGLMKKGDLAFFYHTGDEKAVVGLAEIVSDPYSDPKDTTLTVIDVKPKMKLQRPVTLHEIKVEKMFKDFLLVRISRLSVMPVTKVWWDAINQMAME
ncbi:MAG TPA: EVE domain-containing protein [Bacteroidota bacterium]|nr:EVE domain-containing protein [Bacteroidota bacterium]